jgi:hypothetical protein
MNAKDIEALIGKLQEGKFDKNLTVGGNIALTGTLGVSGAVTTDVLQSAGHGAGAISTAFAPKTYRRTENGIIITTIKFSLIGLKVKGDAANDVIGLASGAAYIGRYVTSAYGIVFKAELSCIEVPHAGAGTITVDIDIATNSSGTLAYDGAASTGKLINGASLVAGQTLINAVPAMTANDYLYIVEADTAASSGTYDTGQYILRMFGHAILTS